MRQVILHPLVVLKLPLKDKDLLAAAKAMVAAITGNPLFPSPDPTVAALSALVAAFDKGVTDARAKIPGAVKARGEAKVTLKLGLGRLRGYVQSIVDGDVDHAATIAESAKMSLRKVPVRHKAVFAIQQGDVSGLVLLLARAVAGARAYFWEFSSDQKVWSVAPQTAQASTRIGGLTPGQTYAFRFRVLTRTGLTDYAQVVTLMVR